MKSISLSNLISFITLVLVPTIFWFVVAELVAFGLEYSYGAAERLALGASIFLLTLWAWALLRITGDE